jgi:hypothetical protein
MHARRGLALALGLLVLAAAGAACGERQGATATKDSGRVADVKERIGGTVDHAGGVPPRDSALLTLAVSAGGDGTVYRPTRDTALLHAGTIAGRVASLKAIVGDSAIVPTHDLTVCKPFTETQVPSEKNGVGNAIVWLVGVETGPVDDSPRRVSLMLDRCRLEPRVQRVALGSTLMITSRDAMMSRLKVTEVGRESVVRANIMLNDAGQVVPTADIAATAGLVEVRDDLHPWVRGFLAIAPHPFVFVTDADGAFRFDSVPAGTYTLVVWQEKLGVRTKSVRVTTGVETRIAVEY